MLHIFGNFSGDLMNFEMAAEMAAARGVPVRTIVTTDDIASAPVDTRAARRGVAGNVFVFKIAGPPATGCSAEACAGAGAARQPALLHTMGIALEPGASVDSQKPSFRLGADDMEIGVGVHGERGIARAPLASADGAADLIVDRILDEMRPAEGDRVALLVNSLGGTPKMELYILNRRLRERLRARGVQVHRTLIGHYTPRWTWQACRSHRAAPGRGTDRPDRPPPAIPGLDPALGGPSRPATQPCLADRRANRHVSA